MFSARPLLQFPRHSLFVAIMMDALPLSVTSALDYNPRLAAFGAVFVLLAVVALIRNRRGAWKHLPPGPRGIPLLGNVRELLGDRWLNFTALQEKYGQLTAARLSEPAEGR
jgi:hypothetical protein